MKKEKKNNIKKLNFLENIKLKDLTIKVACLSEFNDPYSVSKEIQNIKALFYQKINKEKEENELDNHKLKILNKEEGEFKLTINKFKDIKNKFRKKKEKIEIKNLENKKKIISEIKSLTEEKESIKKTFTKFKELQKKWKETGYVPTKEKSNLWKSYHHNVELFYDFIKINDELRDIDFTKNLQKKIKICEMAESLINERSFNKMHLKLQALHDKWKNTGPVKKEERELIWERFKNISKKLNKKRNEYFILKKQEDKNKINQKNNILEKIDKLLEKKASNHQEWKLHTIQCKALENKWKEIQGINQKDTKICWRKLNFTLNKFYKEKNKFYKKNKIKNKEIINKKHQLCIKANQIKNNTDWKETTSQFIILQKEWKNLEYLYKPGTKRLWKDFKQACDTFFNAKKDSIKKIEKENKNKLIEKEILIQELKKLNLTKDKKEDIKLLENYLNKWIKLSFDSKKEKEINTSFLSLINKKYEKIGLENENLEMKKYINKIKIFINHKTLIKKEKEKLEKEINIINKEINQYKNNISFLSNNKETEPLIKKVLEKIDLSKEEIKNIYKKINILKIG